MSIHNVALNSCLVTGLPGSGKTQLVVQWLMENAKAEAPRLVFSNINGLNHKELRTYPLKDTDFVNIRLDNYPTGSVFVVDEAQDAGFHPHSAAARKPEHIALLEKHRHSGYSFIFITQHPKFLDAHVRRLMTSHYHCFRAFNRNGRTVRKWESVNDNPEPANADASCQKEDVPFLKDTYTLYTSSQQHNMKKAWPIKKLLIFAGSFFLVVFCFVYVFSSISSRADAGESQEINFNEQRYQVTANHFGEYSGHVLKRMPTHHDLTVLFNLGERTFTLSDFTYILENETVKTYDKKGNLFAVFTVPTEIRGYL